MTYTDEQLTGMEKCPLVNDAFCIDTFRRWKTINKLWPWDMTYEEWKQWNDKHSPALSDNVYVRVDQQLVRLSNLRHWFDAIARRISDGHDIETRVLEDYKARTGS